jgi:hypothetical protein
MRALLLTGLGITGLLMAQDEARQAIQVTNTQHFDFPVGGALRLKNSVGVLNVEGWDQPAVEITTIKSTRREYASYERQKAERALEQVRVAAQRQGNELIVTTDFPRYRSFPPPVPFGAISNFHLEYRIKAPANTRLVVEHDVGEVNVDNLTSDIDVKLLQGEILLHLPEEGAYAIRGRNDFGHVNSDFLGSEKRIPWILGHSVKTNVSPAELTLNLKVGSGDIVLLKTTAPKEPEPLASERTR